MAAPEGPIVRKKADRGARISAAQKICTECGTPFLASNEGSKTCSDAHRKRRSRRKLKQGSAFTEYDVDISATTAAMEQASKDALDDLPAVARELLAKEMQPYVREALTGEVLQSLSAMLGMMPLVQAALTDDLTALTPVWNDEGAQLLDRDGEPCLVPDYDRRQKAVAMVLKYTVGQPGLAPQPDAPEAAGVTVVFSGMGEPVITSSAQDLDEERLATLESGDSRQCDICEAVKPKDEFVGASSRCEECQAALRARVDASVAAMEARTP